MSLNKYKEKRDFTKTSEPKDTKAKKDPEKLVYVIQRHQSSHLHYDLRLEEEGVLKSWAIPKEPPLRQGIKRLAVQTEDHPLGYEDFEGVIPKSQYGAGEVKIWDKGVYHPLEFLPTRRVFEIQGKKLKGKYCLIKLKSKDKKDKNWLFFKIKNR